MPVITFASSKDGAGKTTAAIALATMLSRSHRVTVIDADQKQGLLTWSKKAPLPGRLQVQGTRGERFIQDEIADATKVSEFVVVDLESSATQMNGFIIGESDLVIIPSAATKEGVKEIFEQVNLYARMTRRDILVRALHSRAKHGVDPSHDPMANNQPEFFQYGLIDSPAFAALQVHGGSLYDLLGKKVSDAPKAIGSADVFREEILELFGLNQDESTEISIHKDGNKGGKTVQMSIRMKEFVYDQFRDIAEEHRYTNGELVGEMMKVWIEKQKRGQSK